jgi:hypothetical protein
VDEGIPLGEALGNLAQQATYGRPSKLDPKKAFKRRMYLLKEELGAVTQDIQKDFYFAKDDAETKAALRDEHIRAWKRKAMQMHETIRAARVLGVPEDEIVAEIYQMRGLNRGLKWAIINGTESIQKIKPRDLKEPM